MTPLRNAARNKKTVTLHLPEPHPKQYEMVNAFEINADKNVRFVIGACGTKYGKTFGCSIRIIKEAWENKGFVCWWVAPTFGQSKMAYDTVKRMMPRGTFTEYKADLKLVLIEPDGSEHSVIQFKSADNDDSLRGFAVNFFVLDEAARCNYAAIVSLMTTTTQTNGHGIIISTPLGRGWFYDYYRRGEKLDDRGQPRFGPLNPDPFPEFFSIRMPTWTNPHVPLESIRQAKKNLPADVFRQEYGAQFIDDSAGVFRNVSGCIRGTMFEGPQAGHHYVMGVDLARLRDYTVITVLDKTRNHVVYIERFNQIAWESQYQKIIQVSRRYHSAVVIDSTGLGDPIVETLRSAGLFVEPYKIGGSSAKQQLIDKLRVNIENERITYPENKYTLPMLEELRAYEYTITEGGVTKFSAPSGGHDDTVISLALANWFSDTKPFIYRAYSMRGV